MGDVLPVAMEFFRGRFQKSFSRPSALQPNKPTESVINLHGINPRFKKGHRIMIRYRAAGFP
jgi:predicted acyl esterase